MLVNWERIISPYEWIISPYENYFELFHPIGKTVLFHPHFELFHPIVKTVLFHPMSFVQNVSFPKRAFSQVEG